MNHQSLFILYIVFFLFAVSFSVLINGLMLRFSRNLGMRNIDENMVRWASSQKPALGGISFYIVFLISIIFYTSVFNNEIIFHNIKLIGIITSVSLGFLMGLADDAYNTKPVLKFLTQVLCGGVLVATGTSINLFDNQIIDYSLTVVWVVGIMNSVNMLDNMDSITTNVSIFIVLACILVSVKIHPISDIYFVLMLGIFAGLIGFLFFNWHPSKMFMGDTGSQFLGAFLAAIGIIYLWNPPEGGQVQISKQVIAIALAFILPIVDTTTVTINRLLKRKSPFIGGRDHTTHHLSYMGLSDRQVAFVYIGISLVSMFFTILIYFFIENWTTLHFLFFSLYILVVFFSLYLTTRYFGPKVK